MLFDASIEACYFCPKALQNLTEFVKTAPRLRIYSSKNLGVTEDLRRALTVVNQAGHKLRFARTRNFGEQRVKSWCLKRQLPGKRPCSPLSKTLPAAGGYE
jgi:hypothetical protein